MKTSVNVLGQRLRQLRGKKTQQDISKVLGITETAYGHYERGNRSPDIYTLQQLSDYFNTSVDYLIGKTDVLQSSYFSHSVYTKEEKAVLEVYRKLTEKNQGKLELFLEQLYTEQEKKNTYEKMYSSQDA